MKGEVRCSAGKDNVEKLLAASMAKVKTPSLRYVPHDCRLVMTRTGDYLLACPLTEEIKKPFDPDQPVRVAALDPGIRFF